MTDRIVLWSGILGPLVFLATVVIGGMADPAYSHLGNAVSELGQRGAPLAREVAVGFTISALLSGVFGWGAIRIAGSGETALRTAGRLLMLYAVFAILPGTVFPMDPFGADVTFAGVMHIVMVVLGAVALIALLLVGSRALRDSHPWFSIYSRLSIAAMLAGGVLSAVVGFYGIPLLGAAERLTQAAYLLWMVVFAALLLRRRGSAAGVQPI